MGRTWMSDTVYSTLMYLLSIVAVAVSLLIGSFWPGYLFLGVWAMAFFLYGHLYRLRAEKMEMRQSTPTAR